MTEGRDASADGGSSKDFRPYEPPAQAGKVDALPAPDRALLEVLLDSVPAHVIVIDRALRYVYLNERAAGLFGRPAAEVLGRTVREVIGEAAFVTYGPATQRLLAGHAVHWEGWITFPGPGRRYMKEWLIPYPPGPTPDVAISFQQDLTELKQQEERLAEQLLALQRERALKSSIVDHALVALVSTDDQGRVVEFNPTAEAMFGVARDAALGRSVAELMIPPRHRDAHHAGMRRLAEGGAPRALGRRLKMHALRADGGEFPIEMVLWRTAAGGETFYTASITDLSEREQAELLIARQRDALRQSEKLTAMGSLLAGVAHELNNPLAIAMGRASLLEEKAAGSALADDARRIREATERCGRIVRTFLNMARSKPAAHADVSLNTLASAAAEMLAYSLRTHGIELRLQLDAALPAVRADGDQLGQIVLNLIVNAQQALAAVPGERTIGVETGSDAEGVWLRVADNGPGVPAALTESIFEAYFTTKPEGQGTGMGLAVSRSIAREHGGDLLLQPAPAGTGAAFVLRLPLRPPGAAAAREASAGPDDDAAGVAAAARVLVVDDEAEIGALMRAMLEAAGYEVSHAESGQVAQAMLEEQSFDAIVSDLRMADGDGAALWRAVGARWPKLARRMLFVTGDSLSPQAAAFLAQTGCPALEKPFAREALLEQVRRLLQG